VNFFGAKAAKQNQHPVPTINADPCTQQMGLPGAWHDRLPHFRGDFRPSCGNELQSEYFISIDDGVSALEKLFSSPLREKLAALVYVAEVRTVAKDDLWLSPNYQRESIAIHFTWRQNYQDVMELLPLLEESLQEYNCRPHFGKLFSMNQQQLEKVYPKWNDFKLLRQSMDPFNLFQNQWAKQLFQSTSPFNSI